MTVEEMNREQADNVYIYLLDHGACDQLIDSRLGDPAIKELVGAAFGYGFAKGMETHARQCRENEALLKQAAIDAKAKRKAKTK